MIRRIHVWLTAALVAVAMAGCGGGSSSEAGSPVVGGGGSGSSTTNEVKVSLSLSATTVTAASPATVTAKVVDSTGASVSGAVVSFTVAGGLGQLSASSALTDSNGQAQVTLAPATSATSGADTVTASTTVSDSTASASTGFQLSATSAELTSLTATSGSGDSSGHPLSAYGQTLVTVVLTGVSESSPATVNLNSSCVALGKASISPASTTTTSGSFSATYTDAGCGAVLASDTVTATLAGSGTQVQGSVYLTSPAANALTYVSASPSTIYLKGSGLTESSTVKFQVNDQAGNALPGKAVTMALTTYAGGLAIDGGSAAVTKTTDANGQVSVIVNSGTVPTPVRVSATLSNGVSTVSNELAVGVGLPSELNFSLSQETINLDCASIDGVTNAYTVYAADRSGNPVPAGTALTFWAEGGQIATSVKTSIDASGIASAKAAFVCQEPRPADGRVTVLAYAIGEESFVDLNGNNTYDPGEPFQDLGDIVKDMLYDNSYDPANDEYVSLQGVAAGSSACVSSFVSAYPKLATSANIPSRPNTCDGTWTSRTYVRRAVETVLSTSEAGLIWGGTGGLSSSSCHAISKQSGSAASSATTYYEVGSGDTWYGGATIGSMPLVVSDANAIRLNPMAAGTTLAVSDASTNLKVSVLGSPVASTATAPGAAVKYELTNGATSGTFTLTVTSPSGLSTAYVLGVNSGTRPSTCP